MITRLSKVLYSTARMTTAVDEVPNLTLLYRLKRLLPPSPENILRETTSQALNNKIGILRGDITKLEVDAIVNAANNSLLGGGGVDGAIHRAAGRSLFAECLTLDGCETGDAKITEAYNLPCKKVIHAVGPVYSVLKPRRSAALLASCYTTSLKLAVENDCKSIAFSGLSTGVYGYPSQAAASVAIETVRGFLDGADGDKIEKVVFCTFEMKDVRAYDDLIPRFFPPTEDDLKAYENEDQGGASETVHGGESVDDNVSGESSETEVTIEDLPDVPTTEPSTEDEPAAKKQKPSDV